jgi:microcystin-dependent protein
VPYQGNVWRDGPDGRTPITAAKLTKIEDGVAAAQAEAERAASSATAARASLESVNSSYLSILNAIVPIGAVLPYYGGEPPSNWLLCYGQQVSRTEYPELFKVIGTRAGAGNGSTTFNVPDIRGRVLYGQGATGFTQAVGAVVGETHHQLTVAELPAHGHEVVDFNNRSSYYRAAVSNTDIGINDNGNGYTYATASGSNKFERRPYANDVGGNTPIPIRPSGSVAAMIIRAK